MPYKPPKPCKYPGCVITTPSRQGYCESHAHHYRLPQYPHKKDSRPSAAARGYNSSWQAVREEVLCKHGIPPEFRHLYDVHHEPPYNPAIEPNHRAYLLTPLLRSEHSRVTNRAARGRRVKSLEGQGRDRQGLETIHTAKMGKF